MSAAEGGILTNSARENGAGNLPDSTLARSPTEAGWRYRWLFLALVGWALPIVCMRRTAHDLSPAWTDRGVSPIVLGAAAMLGGAVVATIVLGLLLVSQQLFLDPKVVSCDLLPFEIWPWFERLKQIRFDKYHKLSRRFARWLEPFGPGYTRRVPETGEVVLAPGHGQSALWLGIALVAYLYSYHGLLSGRHLPTETGPFSALFFYLVLVILLHGLLTGLSFLLDYYRIPVLLGMIGFSIISSSLFDTEHVYELKPAYNPAVAAAPVPQPDLELTTLFDDWHAPRRTLVAVSAAGGGIQAAAWTAQVLAGLDEIYGPDFTRSVCIVSGVSGGSVGTMYYMAGGNWTSDGPPYNPELRQQLIEWAESSSLEATGWGMVYPDFMRSIVPFLVPQHVDRGWAIEQSWLNRIRVDHRLRELDPDDPQPSDADSCVQRRLVRKRPAAGDLTGAEEADGHLERLRRLRVFQSLSRRRIESAGDDRGPALGHISLCQPNQPRRRTKDRPGSGEAVPRGRRRLRRERGTAHDPRLDQSTREALHRPQASPLRPHPRHSHPTVQSHSRSAAGRARQGLDLRPAGAARHARKRPQHVAHGAERLRLESGGQSESALADQ